MEYGFIINNVFNGKWKETQFRTVMRLRGEHAGIDGISFTPGTKFDAILSITYFFKAGRRKRKIDGSGTAMVLLVQVQQLLKQSKIKQFEEAKLYKANGGPVPWLLITF